MDPISPLTCRFLTTAQIKTLQQTLNVKTFMDLISISSQDICSAINITDWEYTTMITFALENAQPEPVTLHLLATPQRLNPQSTGIASLDKMLGGGLFPGDMIEFYGKTGSGKTQLCLHLVSQFCHFNKDHSCVLYFDLKNDFNATRLYNFCDASVESLSRVQVFREPNLETLLSQLDDVKNQLCGGINGTYAKSRFIVVDSVPMVIYPAVDQEPYSWRFHQEQLLERLSWLANQLNAPVVLVNHAVTTRATTSSTGSSRPSSSPSNPIAPVKAAMGKYWLHKINSRIQLSRLDGHCNRFVGCLEKSNRASETLAFEFVLTKEKLMEIT